MQKKKIPIRIQYSNIDDVTNGSFLECLNAEYSRNAHQWKVFDLKFLSYIFFLEHLMKPQMDTTITFKWSSFPVYTSGLRGLYDPNN